MENNIVVMSRRDVGARVRCARHELKNTTANPAHQLLTPDVIGLTQDQLNALKGLMQRARRASYEREVNPNQNSCHYCIDIYSSSIAHALDLGR